MKRIILLLCVLMLIVSCVGNDDTNDVQAKQTEILLSEANRQIGMPDIVNFHEKKMLKMLYELRDKSDLICHAYLFNELKGEVGQYLGKCIGFGLPFSVQFSNPEKEAYRFNGGFGTLPQAEPNGLFMPDTLSATWLMMINPETSKPEPVYIEPSIIVSPFQLH